jgi:phosphatidylglycerophosphatase C
MPTLALFDFDGTLTSRDTFPAFIQFVVGKRKYRWGILLLSPILTFYLLKILPNYVAKMLVLRYFLEGLFIESLQQSGESFCQKELPQYLRPAGLETINWHKKQGHRVIVISASVDWWIKPWCESNDLELICTRVKQEEERFTGEYDTPNCYGPEKVRRLKNRIPRLDAYTEIYAYGDSKGDREMLALAHHAFYKPWRN